MRKNVTVVQVFVAGPSDVDDERRQLEEVITELNLTWSHSLNIRLDLLTWRTHAVPGIGEDAQDVVNRSIPDDYDIFIGIMWSRFGSPTSRAGSGTEEEFNRALQRYRQDPTSVRLMFYFKDDPVTPSQLDINQLAKVLAFKERLDAEGVLYATFTRTFDATARIHLGRQIQEWLATPVPAGEPRSESPVTAQDVGVDPDDELGVFDHMELFLEQMASFGAARSRAISAIFELHQKVLERGDKSAITSDIPATRRTLTWMAELLEAMVTRLRTEMPIIGETFESAMNSLGKTLVLADEMGFAANVNTAAMHEGVDNALQTLQTDYEFLQGFRGTIANTPRMTAQLTRAKRRTLEVIDAFANACQYERNTLHQIITTLGPPREPPTPS
jgi:hypothetical protein